MLSYLQALSQSPLPCVRSTTRHPCQDQEASTGEEILVPRIPKLANIKQYGVGLIISPSCSKLNKILAKTAQLCAQ